MFVFLFQFSVLCSHSPDREGHPAPGTPGPVSCYSVSTRPTRSNRDRHKVRRKEEKLSATVAPELQLGL